MAERLLAGRCGVDLLERKLLLDEASVGHAGAPRGGFDDGFGGNAEADVEGGLPRTGQGPGWVPHPVQPRVRAGAVEDDIEPVVVAEFLALGELAPGQLHPRDAGAALDLDAAAFQAAGGQQVEADVVVLDRPDRGAAAGLVAAGDPDGDLLDLLVAQRARITWRAACLASLGRAAGAAGRCRSR